MIAPDWKIYGLLRNSSDETTCKKLFQAYVELVYTEGAKQGGIEFANTLTTERNGE